MAAPVFTLQNTVFFGARCDRGDAEAPLSLPLALAPHPRLSCSLARASISRPLSISLWLWLLSTFFHFLPELTAVAPRRQHRVCRACISPHCRACSSPHCRACFSPHCRACALNPTAARALVPTVHCSDLRTPEIISPSIGTRWRALPLHSYSSLHGGAR